MAICLALSAYLAVYKLLKAEQTKSIAIRSKRKDFADYAEAVGEIKKTQVVSKAISNVVSLSTTEPSPVTTQGLPQPFVISYDTPDVIESLWARAFLVEPQLIVSVLLRNYGFSTEIMSGQKRCEVGGIGGVLVKAYEGWDVHGSTRNTAVVHCKIEKPTTIPEGPGASVKIFDGTPDGLRVSIATPPRPPEAFKLTVCTPVLHGNLRLQWIHEWMDVYYKDLGAEHVFFYSSFSKMRQRLTTEARLDMSKTPYTVIDLSSQQKYKPYYFGQTTAIYDCLLLNRYLRTEWTVFQDLDEILWTPHWPSPRHFFAEKEAACSAVTLGLWSIEIGDCEPVGPGKTTLIERMTNFDKKPFCGYNCPGIRGHRKYAVRPSEVDKLTIHDPYPNNVQRLCQLSVQEAHMRVYWRAVDGNIPTCIRTVTPPKSSKVT